MNTSSSRDALLGLEEVINRLSEQKRCFTTGSYVQLQRGKCTFSYAITIKLFAYNNWQ